ncbi:MAG: ECF transporter S component [Lachnospiraceae bacterium]|nr:ECF transporter S component [Lachnospiraceae bacterium]
MLSAVAFVLMAIDFPVPFMPPFIKMDLSEFPALIGSFALGPIYGIAICFIKNLLNFILRSSTGGVGELSNFLLGACFVGVSGLIYKYKKTRTGALVGSLAGAAAMAIFSVFSNYYLVYPIYTKFMPMEAILAAYQAINPAVENLWQALIWFNMPFTFVKGMLDVLLCFLIYKRLSPILKG